MNWATTHDWHSMILLAYATGAVGPHGRAELFRGALKRAYPQIGRQWASSIRPWHKWCHTPKELGFAMTSTPVGQGVANWRVANWTTKLTLSARILSNPSFEIVEIACFPVAAADFVRASIRLEDHPALMAELI